MRFPGFGRRWRVCVANLPGMSAGLALWESRRAESVLEVRGRTTSRGTFTTFADAWLRCAAARTHAVPGSSRRTMEEWYCQNSITQCWTRRTRRCAFACIQRGACAELGDAFQPDVEVVYVHGGSGPRLRAKACPLAFWHMLIPHVPGMPDGAKTRGVGWSYNVKVPRVYTMSIRTSNGPRTSVKCSSYSPAHVHRLAKKWIFR